MIRLVPLIKCLSNIPNVAYIVTLLEKLCFRSWI